MPPPPKCWDYKRVPPPGEIHVFSISTFLLEGFREVSWVWNLALGLCDLQDLVLLRRLKEVGPHMFHSYLVGGWISVGDAKQAVYHLSHIPSFQFCFILFYFI